MGLDLFFYKCKRSNYNAYNKAIEEWQNEEPQSGKISHEDYEKLSEVEKDKIEKEVSDWYDKRPEREAHGISEIGYFRKVNFLMTFFNYEGNCEYKEIAKYELEDLVERCNAVLTTPKKHRKEKAEDLLPTQSGFFFGSTEYDQYYYDDVKEVRDWASGVLNDLKDEEMVLMYCWW